MAHTTWIEKCMVKVEGKEIKIRKKLLGGKKKKNEHLSQIAQNPSQKFQNERLEKEV